MNVIAVETAKHDGVGNFAWMIKQEKYRNAFFIYLDVDEELWHTDSDFGYNPLRLWNGKRSFSIGVCSKSDGCYFCLNVFTRQIIDAGFSRIAAALAENSEIDTVYYNAAKIEAYGEPVIDTSQHAFVGQSVVKYIMRKLRTLRGTTFPLDPSFEGGIALGTY
jgi:hypothetical protein